MEPRISLVTLGVADLARGRAFYEALGWTTGHPWEAAHNPHWTLRDDGSVEV
jgi:catechol 2,3-dioxygenase-like lactoylglutathione lyase family enzyme